MAAITYHHHTILSTPAYDDNTGNWKSSVSVTWPETGPTHGVRFLTRSPELFGRFEDAEQAGVETGKNWVDSDYKRPLTPLTR